MKKNYKKLIRMNNAIDPATTTAKDWGFHPIPGKGGKTTNSVITDRMFQRELKEMEGHANA